MLENQPSALTLSRLLPVPPAPPLWKSLLPIHASLDRAMVARIMILSHRTGGQWAAVSPTAISTSTDAPADAIP
eukprot:1760150-Pyramimonas_sp.AAC.1